MTIDKMKTGIIGIEYALPTHYVSHDDLAKELNVDPAKYKVGLGCEEFGVASDRDDPISLAMTAIKRLMSKHKIRPEDVSRLEVGTESNFDTSKSIKSYLMDMFPNKNISGTDCVNACYGGTSALLNTIYWMESKFYDGKYAIVVATDISQYKDIALVPVSGAGSVAILLGQNPVFVFEKEIVHHFENEHTFIRPVDCYPYPVLNGKGSIDVYSNAFKSCFEQIGKYNYEYKYIVMHSPYPKLIVKTAAAASIESEKAIHSLYISKRNGNSYTASVYHALISLLYNKGGELGIHDRILLFSFGSGCASSMFLLRKVAQGCEITDLKERLDSRIRLSACEHLKRLGKGIQIKNYVPQDKRISDRVSLVKIEDYRRYYE